MRVVQNGINAEGQAPGPQQKGQIMASFDTKKNYTKAETIARRAHRAAKYTNAAMTNRSGRTRRTIQKAAW